MSGLVRVSNPIIAYHGSPHRFDQFDIAHIGNGEGAQAYGHGLYFAGNEKIARGYRDALSGHLPQPVETRNGKFLPDEFEGPENIAARAVTKYSGSLGWKQFIRRHARDDDEALAAMRLIRDKEIQAADPGYIYKVALHVDPHSLLDWDKPISEQSPKIQNAASHLYQMGKKDLRFGQKLQPHGVDESAILESLGVPGLKYLDAGSRSAGDGTRNYVMFHHDPVEMLEHRAIGGTVAKRAYGGGIKSIRPIIAYRAQKGPIAAFDPAMHHDPEQDFARHGERAINFSENEEEARRAGEKSVGDPEIKTLRVGPKTVGPHNGFDYSPKTRDLHENILGSVIEDMLIDEHKLTSDPKAAQALALEHLDNRIEDYKDNWPEGLLPAKRLRRSLAEPGAVELKLRPRHLFMHKVAIHADPSDFLDWDKTIGEQHPKHAEKLAHLGAKPEQYPEDLLKNKGAANALYRSGVAGLKYSGAGIAKAKGQGTHDIGSQIWDLMEHGGDGQHYVMFGGEPTEVLERRRIMGEPPQGRAYGGHINNLGRNADNVFWIKNWDDQEAPVVKNPTKRDLMSMTKVPKAADKDSWRHASLGYLITPHGHSYVFPSSGLIHDTVVHALRGKFQEPGFNDYQSSWAEAGEKPKTGDVKVGGIYRTGEDQFHSDDIDDLSQLMRGRQQRARGGHTHMKHPRHAKIHTGPIRSGVAGRTDHLPINVPQGSYVLPADIVSSLGEGNTEAGLKVAKSIFSAHIYGQKKLGSGNPYNANGLPYGMPSPRANGGATDTVPVVVAGGEFILSPEEVLRVGSGDLARGHKILDDFVLGQRAKTIKVLKRLPGPAKD